MDEKRAEDGALADFFDGNLLKIAAQRVICIWQVNLSPGCEEEGGKQGGK